MTAKYRIKVIDKKTGKTIGTNTRSDEAGVRFDRKFWRSSPNTKVVVTKIKKRRDPFDIGFDFY